MGKNHHSPHDLFGTDRLESWNHNEPIKSEISISNSIDFRNKKNHDYQFRWFVNISSNFKRFCGKSCYFRFCIVRLHPYSTVIVRRTRVLRVSLTINNSSCSSLFSVGSYVVLGSCRGKRIANRLTWRAFLSKCNISENFFFLAVFTFWRFSRRRRSFPGSPSTFARGHVRHRYRAARKCTVMRKPIRNSLVSKHASVRVIAFASERVHLVKSERRRVDGTKTFRP